MQLSLNKIIFLFLTLSYSANAETPKKEVTRLNEYELDRTVGNQIENPIRAKWKTSEPQAANLAIYATSIPPLDEAMMKRVATHFGLKGELEQIKGDTMGHVGFEISEPNSTNKLKSRSLAYWITTGSFSYAGGGDGHYWDLKNHKLFAEGVPSKEEAKQKAIELLPLFGLSTNDFAYYPNGRIKWASSTSTISYNERGTMERKTVPVEQSVSFYQKIPNSGESDGIGDGGSVRFSFGRAAKISQIEWCFRKLEKAGEAKPKTSREILRDLKNRNAWTWHETIPTDLTITNCVLAYPQGNSFLNQKYLWPFYRLIGSAKGNAVTLFVPLEY